MSRSLEKRDPGTAGSSQREQSEKDQRIKKKNI